MIRAIGPPEVTTTAVPLGSIRSTSASRAPRTRWPKAVNDSSYSWSCRPAVHRSVAASNQAWNSRFVGVSPANVCGWRSRTSSWFISSHASSSVQSPHPAASPRIRAVSRCRFIATVQQRDRTDATVGERPAEDGRLLRTEVGEHVVVLGAPGGLAVPDQQHLAHPALPAAADARR